MRADSPHRVAVVVPCYNSGATLLETLGSLRGEPAEVVVVDDGSTDERTLDVLAQAEAEGARVIRQENAGVARARMRGVRETSAPYVFPLDADDLVARGGLAALADALDANPQAKLAWGYVGLVGGRTISKQAPRLDPWLITYVNQIPVMSLIRRQALLETGGWRPDAVYEDWDLWLTFAERGWSGIRVPRVVAYYRLSGTSRWAASRGEYAAAVERMAADHRSLFAARGENRRHSRAPRRLKLLLPAIDRLPLSAIAKRRLGELVRRPTWMIHSAVARRLSS